MPSPNMSCLCHVWWSGFRAWVCVIAERKSRMVRILMDGLSVLTILERVIWVRGYMVVCGGVCG